MTTNTAQGIPGDPLNVSLVGSEDEVVAALERAGWKPADAITLKSSARIARKRAAPPPRSRRPRLQSLLRGPPPGPGVREAGGRQRATSATTSGFWRVLDEGAEGRPVWLGAATFDASVGLSRYTGQITHHISPDIDAERDGLIFDLNEAGALAQIYQVTGSGPTLLGRNGEGDRYITDGEMTVGVLRTGELAGAVPAAILPNSSCCRIKNSAISAIKAVVIGEE